MTELHTLEASAPFVVPAVPDLEDEPAYALHLGDCLDVMPTLAPAGIDLVLCDLPYGTTQCRWDAVIPFGPLWAAYERVLAPHRSPSS